MRLTACCLALTALLLLASGGCTAKTDTPAPGDATTTTTGHDHDHDHHDHGPRDGQLVKLGPAHQAELLFDENDEDKIIAYVLDAAGKQEARIDADRLTLVFTVNNEEQTFDLAAADVDADGKSSRYELHDEDAAAAIEQHDLNPRLRATIDGQAHETAFRFHDH